MNTFRQKTPFALRQQESKQVLDKYPDRIPCIVDQAPNTSLDLIDKHKFLVPNDLTVYHFQYIIRKRLKLH